MIMLDSVLNMSKKQIEDAIRILNPCMNDYLYVFDLKEDYYVISKHATERFILPSDKFYNATKKHEDFVYPEDISMLGKEIEQIKAGKKKFHDMKYRWLDKHNNPVWINCRGSVLFDENTQPHYLVGCINEIGVKPEADNVSGLLGEYALDRYIKDTCTDNIPDGFIIRMSIDNFSTINADFGMSYGDFILKRTAECILESIKPTQKLFKAGSDEFIIVDFNGSSINEAVDIYKQCKKHINNFIENNRYNTIYTLSAGIINTRDITLEEENYVKLSEFALKTAKDNGRNNYYIYSKTDYDSYKRKLYISKALHNAVNEDFKGFQVFYQPVVDASTYMLTGAEALMRFSIKKEGVDECEYISPVEFIPVLEETGLIIPAGRWILEQSAKQCSIWNEHVKDFRVNINVSYIQVMKSDVFSDIMSVIDKYSLQPSCIGIELTESGYLDSSTHFNHLWRKLKDNGVYVILDDFGTGYSNLHCLSDLKPNYIKIDRTFTLKALKNKYDYKLMTYIIDMAHSLGLKLCIEGVETSDDLRQLRQSGVDYIQGYLFGKPYPAVEFEKRYVNDEKLNNEN
ncbi:MAG: EAL domain-containing protein [Lachnospira sp.]|nr:EAL domain-containing protein [Lachnospira sp.]HBD65699.1 GGDEF-domain containing protein [Eubacterium sp.]